MSNITAYKDVMAFHPGYYIAELIEQMDINQAEFAARLGTTPKTVSLLVNGQTDISKDLAKKLSAMTGTSISLWLNLQSSFDQKCLEIEAERDFDEQEEIAKLIDYGYFVENVGFPKTSDRRKRVATYCQFFAVSDLRVFTKPDFLVNFRSGASPKTEKNIINSRAWIQTAITLSKDIHTEPFSAAKLKQALPELRKMTVEKPDVFMPKMKEIFADCGVIFVVLPHLKNSGVNAAVKWSNDDRVILAMNNRGLDADKFWFSLFHEIKHVLQQKTKTVFISGSIEEQEDINNSLEQEANEFAANYLIPPRELRKFSPTKYTTDNEIVAFANSIGIHPGIVAGRLQYEKIIPHNRCSKLKEKYMIAKL
jgi:addiction module HigA family antidote